MGKLTGKAIGDKVQETKNLYSENCKMLMTGIKTQTGQKIYCVLDWKNQYCQSHYTTQGNLPTQCSIYRISNDIFHRARTKIF